MKRRELPLSDARRATAHVGLARSVRLFALLSAAVCVTALTVFPVSNNDIWIHLTTGQYVLEHGRPPVTDPYSYTAADHAYVAHEWLAAVLFRLSYNAAGLVGLILFKSLVVGATCALLFLAARKLRAQLAVFVPALTAALFIASPRFMERPHVFSYLLVALYLWVLLSFRESGHWRWLCVILPAQMLWANLHGGWVLGIALAAVFAIGEGIAHLRARWLRGGHERTPAARDVALLAALAPACLLATLVNPYGARLLRFPFELEGLGFVQESNFEWQPPYHPAYNTTTMFVFYLVYLGALWAALLFARRGEAGMRSGRGRVSWLSLMLAGALTVSYLALIAFWLERPATHWTPGVLEFFLYFLFAVLVAHTLKNFRTADFSQAGIVALFLLLSLRHNRSVTDATLAMLPILAGAWSAVLAARKGASSPAAHSHAELARWQDPSRPAAVLAGSVLMLAVSAGVFAFGYRYDALTPLRRTGVGITPNMPVCATEFVRTNRITGNAFVSYTFAGMLIEKMYPDVKVNIDSRNDVYGDALYQDYREALDAPDSMRRFLERYPVDFFLLSYADRTPAVFDWLESTSEWAPVYYDDRAFILVRRRPDNEKFVADHEFRLFKPTSTQAIFSLVEAPHLLEETERAIRDCPAGAVGHQYKGGALLLLGRYEEALAASRRAAELAPGQPLAHLYMGLALEGLGRRDEAIAAFERTLALAPEQPLAQQELRRLRGSP